MIADHSFRAQEVLPGVWQIQDPMGVCMTLLKGTNQSLLVDTGYGTADVSAFAASLTDTPLTVILTHGHHDHMLGARWFPKVMMFPEDLPDFHTYSALDTRRRIMDSALSKGLPLPEDYLTCPIPQPLPLTEGDIDLGGLTAQIIRCPGHTPGSAVVWVKEHQLLLTGDDWNPCTWLFFPAALPVAAYRENVRRLLALPIRHVLCSHQPHLYDRFMLEDFLQALTDDVLAAAQPVNVGYPQDTRKALLPHGQELVFDWNKFRKE